VVLGKEPSTYIVAEGALERLVTDDGVGLACNCGAKRGPCPHVLAVERYRKQA
jgi:SWIM zinc finger